MSKDGRFEINGIKFSVNCPSYKRPKVETLDYLPWCRVYVSEDEYTAYKQMNDPEANIIPVNPKFQGNVCRIRNHIMDREFAEGMDAVVIIDDDMKSMMYWYEGNAFPIKEGDFANFIAKYTQMAIDLDVHLWGVNVNQDKQVYREYTPFSTTAYIGSPFQCFVNDDGLRYDERFPLKEDYDFTLQQLNRHRKVLRVNGAFYMVKQASQTGGCASYRNYSKEKQQLEGLIAKWGSDIVKVDNADRSHNLSKVKSAKRIDFNPIIKAPIKGV